MEDKIRQILEAKFELDELTPIQRDAILATLAKKDCFVTMPSGTDKSLIYQLPAVHDKGITIVISPYLATINTEIAYLRSLDIEVETLSGELEFDEYLDLLERLNSNQASDISLLYLTPEKFVIEEESSQTKIDIQKALTRLHKQKLIARFVIDEASNILLWGNNFRDNFYGLDRIKEDFPGVPIMATTSAANREDRQEIVRILDMQVAEGDYFSTNLCRSNIDCIVKQKNENSIYDIRNEIQQKFKSQSGIIFCRTIKECEYNALRLSSEGIKAVAYHADISDPLRKQILERWIKNDVDVICATLALGAETTKNDIRFVIHFTMTKSIVEYFLQINLAGRDGQQAYCYLYYSEDDFDTFTYLIKEDGKKDGEESSRKRLLKLTEMKYFCRNTPINFGSYFNDK